ncbi:CrcB family protein [Fructobacillus sp. M1-13]|uniref:Fluoride-specific ion channel FluC n=1 Tax=Fructobacillus papyriferae TaxID=2713171 RepID=A0ABS5QQN1_9LACO|nr:CrcB family protein [Fructobacillus papyriferae]MBS9335147.1 CrcB family protein [Fructobacillus papyriferae]MCD2159183.1 CrcB family protein [Fructobacillus papyriferae]
MVKQLLVVMLGTGIGSVLRSLILMFWPSQRTVLTGVLAVNLLGSFFLGVLSSLSLVKVLTLFLETGLLGGLTTFSSMMTESEQFGAFMKQAGYLTLQFVSGFAAFGIGYLLF